MDGTTSTPERGERGPAPNYKIIVPDLLNGEVIPFLGAGASVFHRRLLDDESRCPPSASELARKLADTANFPDDGANSQPSREDLARVASYYAYVAADRENLRRRLREVFTFDFELNQLQKTLAKIAAKRKPILIITTNYDDMMERAFQLENVNYHLVVTAIEERTIKHREPGSSVSRITHPQDLNLCLDSDYSIIYKMHGSIDRIHDNYRNDHYVITEEDYVDFVGRIETLIPSTISALFMNHNILFLGYSLRDWNFRVMLSSALRKKSALKSWAIQQSANRIDQKLWEKKNIDIYNMDLNEFSEELAKYVNEKVT